MKTILVITPHLPYRNVGHAGGKAIYDFLVRLKERNFKVCLVSLALPEEGPMLAQLTELCDATSFVTTKPVFTDTFLNSFESNPFAFPWKFLRGTLKHFMIKRRLTASIREVVSHYSPDIIQVEYSTMVLYLGRINSRQLRVLHLHDVMSKPYRRLYEAEKRLFARLIRFFFFLVVRYMEVSFCRSFDKLLVKSDYDKDLLFREAGLSSEVFPLAIEPVSESVISNNREPGSILFVGAMFRDVNEKAALYLIDRVVPLLEREIPGVKLYIAGSSPSRTLKARCSEKIVVTGFVEDLAPFFRRCQVFVAPMFIGGGMVFKVIQAMSYGLPVVASTIANEGIRAIDGEQILIADDPAAFCAKILALTRDQQLWQRIAFGGQAFVNSTYSWDLVMKDYLNNLNINHLTIEG